MRTMCVVVILVFLVSNRQRRIVVGLYAGAVTSQGRTQSVSRPPAHAPVVGLQQNDNNNIKQRQHFRKQRLILLHLHCIGCSTAFTRNVWNISSTRVKLKLESQNRDSLQSLDVNFIDEAGGRTLVFRGWLAPLDGRTVRNGHKKTIISSNGSDISFLYEENDARNFKLVNSLFQFLKTGGTIKLFSRTFLSSDKKVTLGLRDLERHDFDGKKIRRFIRLIHRMHTKILNAKTVANPWFRTRIKRQSSIGATPDSSDASNDRSMNAKQRNMSSKGYLPLLQSLSSRTSHHESATRSQQQQRTITNETETNDEQTGFPRAENLKILPLDTQMSNHNVYDNAEQLKINETAASKGEWILYIITPAFFFVLILVVGIFTLGGCCSKMSSCLLSQDQDSSHASQTFIMQTESEFLKERERIRSMGVEEYEEFRRKEMDWNEELLAAEEWSQQRLKLWLLNDRFRSLRGEYTSSENEAQSNVGGFLSALGRRATSCYDALEKNPLETDSTMPRRTSTDLDKSAQSGVTKGVREFKPVRDSQSTPAQVSQTPFKNKNGSKRQNEANPVAASNLSETKQEWVKTSPNQEPSKESISGAINTPDFVVSSDYPSPETSSGAAANSPKPSNSNQEQAKKYSTSQAATSNKPKTSSGIKK